jgi:hypothetical protein
MHSICSAHVNELSVSSMNFYLHDELQVVVDGI